MANNIKNWNVDPDKNDKESPYGWKEDMAPSDVNNTARQEMADLKDAYVNQPWFSVGNPTVNYTLGGGSPSITIQDDAVDTNYAKYFPEGRAVRLTDTSGEKHKLVVKGATYDPDTGESRITLYGWDVDVFTILATNFSFTNDVEIGLEPDIIPAGPDLLGCVLPFTAQPNQLRFGFGLADGTTFNPDLYVDLATLYLVSGTVGSTDATYIHGQEYNEAAGKNWPKKPDVRGLYPKFSSSSSASNLVSHTFTGNHERTTDVRTNAPLTKTSDQIQDLDGWLIGAFYQDPDGKLFKKIGGNYGSSKGSGDWNQKVEFHASGVARTGDTTEVMAYNAPGVLVMIGGYGKAGTLTPEQLADVVIEKAQEYIDEHLPENVHATTTSYGSVVLASEEEAIDPTDAESAMTPAMTKLAIDTFAPKVSDIEALSTRIDALETSKADKTELEAVEADIATLQQTKASNESVAQVTRELNNAVDEINQLIMDVEDKADKATTLAGYGIEDAYTKTEVDALIDQGGGGGGGTANLEKFRVTIAKSAWDDTTNSVEIADYANEKAIYWVAPDSTDEMMALWANCGCYATRDDVSLKLKLYCKTVPSNAEGFFTVLLVYDNNKNETTERTIVLGNI